MPNNLEERHSTNKSPTLETWTEPAYQYNTSQSAPLGRALYGKYLLAFKYVHHLKNMTLGNNYKTALFDKTCK